MKRILFVLPFLFIFRPAFSAAGQDTLFSKLDSILDRKQDFDAEKLARIEKLQQDLNNTANPDLNQRYKTYLALYEEYKSFNYEKAFGYAKKLQQTGNLLKDPVKIAVSRIKFGFISLSSGMFKEVFDSLKTVNVKLLDNASRKEYYFLMGRTYYDISDYDKDDYYTPIYNTRAGKYIDSAVALCQPN